MLYKVACIKVALDVAGSSLARVWKWWFFVSFLQTSFDDSPWAVSVNSGVQWHPLHATCAFVHSAGGSQSGVQLLTSSFNTKMSCCRTVFFLGPMSPCRDSLFMCPRNEKLLMDGRQVRGRMCFYSWLCQSISSAEIESRTFQSCSFSDFFMPAVLMAHYQWVRGQEWHVISFRHHDMETCGVHWPQSEDVLISCQLSTWRMLIKIIVRDLFKSQGRKTI